MMVDINSIISAYQGEDLASFPTVSNQPKREQPSQHVSAILSSYLILAFWRFEHLFNDDIYFWIPNRNN